MYRPIITLLYILGLVIVQINGYECPVNWLSYNESCYYLSTEESDFNTAHEACLKSGSQLASIHSYDELVFLKQYSMDRTYRIGLNELMEVNYWLWSDGTEVDYENWGPSEPSFNTLQYEDTAVVDFSATTNTWWGRNSTGDDYPYICKITPIEAGPPGPPGAPGLGYTCDSSWVILGWECYYFSSVATTWIEAYDSCVFNTSQLASIHSYQQSSWISLNGKEEEYWIGLNDISEEGEWMWTDGSQVNYLNWGEDYTATKTKSSKIVLEHRPTFIANITEPMPPTTQAPGSDQDCVTIRTEVAATGSNLWYDHVCIQEYPYVCKRPANEILVKGDKTNKLKLKADRKKEDK